MYFVTRGWESSFPYRVRQIPHRKLAAHTAFETKDLEATREAAERAKSKIACLYEHDLRLLEEIRQSLINEIFQIKEKPAADVVTAVWPHFYLSDAADQAVDEQLRAAELEAFKQAIAGDERLETLRGVLQRAFLEIDGTGLLDNLEHELNRGSMLEIQVYRRGDRENARTVEVSKVRIAEAADQLRKNLLLELEKESTTYPNPQLVANHLFHWLRSRLPVTLKWNDEESRRESILAASKVEPKMRRYAVGDPLQLPNANQDQPNVFAGGQPLAAADIQLLLAEHQAGIDQASWVTPVFRTLLFFLVFALSIGIVAAYLGYRDRKMLLSLKHFAIIVTTFTIAFSGAWMLSWNLDARLEIIAIALCTMMIAIAYHVELAVLMGSVVSILFTLFHRYDLGEFLVLTTAVLVAALACSSIRSRAKSVYVGLLTAAVVFPVAICVPFLQGWQPHWATLVDALWFGGGAGVAGLMMTALLPFFERWFDIQTDISLLELSDPNHPLLKQLIQRAPGTYNHSINVASIAETAAESIGANGLLCRVGAYFHDIGKMRKPEYFVENQASGENKHDELVPTMSTIVIISHVKDGIELARQHHLPRRIVDMIEQHHGTTVIEFFYHRATQQSTDESRLEESDFRYPGPKPQSIEAAILMLSDAIEGASRTLREPTPARIESIVNEIAKKRMDDGQFDDCPITMQQIYAIQESLTKSLNAMFHARVKYPEQQTA